MIDYRGGYIQLLYLVVLKLQTLAELRSSFQRSDDAADSMRYELLKQLGREKMDQLRQLKAEAALARQAREEVCTQQWSVLDRLRWQGERELLQNMQMLQQVTAAELQSRAEKEHVRRTLLAADRARLEALETEKREQVMCL